jgi:hypothetical protein
MVAVAMVKSTIDDTSLLEMCGQRASIWDASSRLSIGWNEP